MNLGEGPSLNLENNREPTSPILYETRRVTHSSEYDDEEYDSSSEEDIDYFERELEQQAKDEDRNNVIDSMKQR